MEHQREIFSNSCGRGGCRCESVAVKELLAGKVSDKKFRFDIKSFTIKVLVLVFIEVVVAKVVAALISSHNRQVSASKKPAVVET